MSFLAFIGLASAPALEIGRVAPDVAASDETGQEVNVADLSQNGLTLFYFYPKADTPGCTVQACALRDSFTALQDRGVRIFGVSRDDEASQKRFREKFQLPFQLIADSDGEVAEAFGVPTFLGFSKRQSFLIKDGKLVWRNLSVSPKTHVSEVNAFLETLR